MIKSAINYTIPPSIITFLTFIYPKCANSCDEGDVMAIFGIITFILWIAISLLKFLAEKIIKKQIVITLRQKIVYGIVGITILFIGSLLSIHYIPIIENSGRSDFYVILTVMYIVSVTCISIYTFLGWLSKKFSETATEVT
jgi:hypothetical protein